MPYEDARLQRALDFCWLWFAITMSSRMRRVARCFFKDAIRNEGKRGMRKGIYCSLISSCTFALLYYVVTLMAPLGGLELLGVRSIILLPALVIILCTLRLWGQARGVLDKVKKHKGFILVPLSTAALVAALQWLFFWAPLNGKALEVSLGFFLLPLLMVVVGNVVYQEKITPLKALAVLLAFIGVGNMVWQSGGISWPAICISFGYTIYIGVRKKFGINNLGGLLWETVFIAPVAIYLVVRGSMALSIAFAENASLLWVLPLFGVVSVCSLSFYILASDFLPLGMFGLLSYIEPVLLFLVSLYVGETPQDGESYTFILLMLALAVLAFEGAKTIRHELRMRKKARYKHHEAPVGVGE